MMGKPVSPKNQAQMDLAEHPDRKRIAHMRIDRDSYDS